MQIYVRIKSVGKRKDILAPTPYTISDSIENLRQLLTVIAETEVAKYNQKEADAQLIPYLTQEEVDAQADMGKVSFGQIYSAHKANREKAVENVIQCWEDGLVRVFMEDTELTELDAPLTIAEGAVFTFIRLTFLAGRMW